MALTDLKVIELAGLAPAPFCGMVLADFGATVLRVDKLESNVDGDCLANGKKTMSLNLKHPEGISIFKTLCKDADVLIEPFRKGVMEKLGIGPEVLMKENPRLIYARLTGYGQNGSLTQNAGHDINFIGISGLLSTIGRAGENPVPPVNIVADIGGGGLMCALGILMALHERSLSGLGQIVDNSMVRGTAYLGSWIYRSQRFPYWGNERGENALDTGSHYYEVYKTKDGKYMSVGSLESQFYTQLLKGLGLTKEETPQWGDCDKLKKILSEKFLEKTRQEWCDIFDSLDACVTPVLTLDEAPYYQHNIQEETFTKTDTGFSPNPGPKLSRTPAKTKSTEAAPVSGQHTEEILQSLGFALGEIRQLQNNGVIACHSKL